MRNKSKYIRGCIIIILAFLVICVTECAANTPNYITKKSVGKVEKCSLRNINNTRSFADCKNINNSDGAAGKMIESLEIEKNEISLDKTGPEDGNNTRNFDTYSLFGIRESIWLWVVCLIELIILGVISLSIISNMRVIRWFEKKKRSKF